MKKIAMLKVIAGFAILMAPIVTGSQAIAGGNTTNQTGQGIMANLHTSGTFAIVSTDIYRFDQDTAAGYFSNVATGSVTYSCNGNACNGDICGVPAAPAAPAADPSRIANPGGSGVADKSRCTFLDGGTLTLTDTYTQQTAEVPVSCSVLGNNGKLIAKDGKYTFTYTYAIAPFPDTATVAPFTAWPLAQHNEAGQAQVDVTADIAGESVLVKNITNKKYSFSMLDNYGMNRVQNLTLALDGTPVAYPGSTVKYPVDFTYTTNAGSNGATGYLVNGDARTILNSDSFAGNDNGGADGSALALAVMDPVSLFLGPGTFTVELTGTVKDNSALASLPIDVTQTITIVTPGCGQGQ